MTGQRDLTGYEAGLSRASLGVRGRLLKLRVPLSGLHWQPIKSTPDTGQSLDK